MEMKNENKVRKRYKMAEAEWSCHKLVDNIAELRESTVKEERREREKMEQTKAKCN